MEGCKLDNSRDILHNNSVGRLKKAHDQQRPIIILPIISPSPYLFFNHKTSIHHHTIFLLGVFDPRDLKYSGRLATIFRNSPSLKLTVRTRKQAEHQKENRLPTIIIQGRAVSFRVWMFFHKAVFENLFLQNHVLNFSVCQILNFALLLVITSIKVIRVQFMGILYIYRYCMIR